MRLAMVQNLCGPDFPWMRELGTTFVRIPFSGEGVCLDRFAFYERGVDNDGGIAYHFYEGHPDVVAFSGFPISVKIPGKERIKVRLFRQAKAYLEVGPRKVQFA